MNPTVSGYNTVHVLCVHYCSKANEYRWSECRLVGFEENCDYNLSAHYHHDSESISDSGDH